MKNAEDLIELLEEDVILEIEDVIDALFETVNENKSASDEDKKELQELQELRSEFVGMLEEVKNGELDEDECEEIIDEIDAMRQEGEDGE